VATVRTRRQRLGQHFLRDARTAHSIAAALAGEPPRVLEIGPGDGALTRHLLARFAAVRALELDGDLAAMLPGRLGRPATLEVIRGDAVTADLDELAAGGPWQVAANLPYGVGTPILRRLLPRGDLFTVLVVMVQLEVARRLVAPPGGAERGLLTIEVEARTRAELLFTVSPRSFSPPPHVHSGVVRLVLQPPPDAPVLDRALELAAVAFCHRRKKLTNALSAVGRPPELSSAMERAGVDAGARPQDLTLAGWLALAGALPRETSP
jgi:16S rRNA (adenine1518-N6/adenine1519-N6)-dimethyltransferase